MRILMFASAAFVAVLAAAGCGRSGPAEVTDVQLGSTEQIYAAGVRNEVESLVQSMRDERGGIPALRSEMEATIENVEFMESNVEEKAGQYKETCQKIFQNMRELHEMLQGSPNREQVQAKLDELQQLAEQLPESAVQDGGGAPQQ